MYKLNLSRVFDTPACVGMIESRDGARCALGKILYGILGKPLVYDSLSIFELRQNLSRLFESSFITDIMRINDGRDEETKNLPLWVRHIRALRLMIQVGLEKGIFELDEESKVNYAKLNNEELVTNE